MTIYTYGGVILTEGNAIAVHEDCCCGSTTCYLLRPCDADSNTCNSCDPPLPDVIYVTIAGSGGVPDGVYACEWLTGCTWESTDPSYTVNLVYNSGTGKWGVIEFNNFDTWEKSDAGGCTPHGGTYSLVAGTGTAAVAMTDPTSNAVAAGELGVDDDLSTYAFGDVIYYNGVCYYFVGEITCPATPTTMGTWTDYSSCGDCGATTCNSCSPALPNKYTVTFDGLAGDFAGLEGPYDLINTGSGGDPGPENSDGTCTWSYSSGGVEVYMWYGSSNAYWQILLWLASGCEILFEDPDGIACDDPAADVNWAGATLFCSDVTCSDSLSCDNSTPTVAVS